MTATRGVQGKVGRDPQAAVHLDPARHCGCPRPAEAGR